MVSSVFSQLQMEEFLQQTFSFLIKLGKKKRKYDIKFVIL